MKFPSDREDFHVKMFILSSLAIFGPLGRGSKLGNKWNNKSSETICWAVPHPGSLVWLVVESNNFCNFSLGHSKISAQCRLHMRGHNEDFSTSTCSSWVLTTLCSLGPALFVGFYIPLLLFIPLIILDVCMVHIQSIKSPLHLVLGVTIPILDISGYLILWFIYSP